MQETSTFAQIAQYVQSVGGDPKKLPWQGEPDRWTGGLSEDWWGKIYRCPYTLAFKAEMLRVGISTIQQANWWDYKEFDYTHLGCLTPMDWLQPNIALEWAEGCLNVEFKDRETIYEARYHTFKEIYERLHTFANF
jgi:hypothetical protein